MDPGEDCHAHRDVQRSAGFHDGPAWDTLRTSACSSRDVARARTKRRRKESHPDVRDAARRFVTLIDELYDRNVNLVCTAAAEPPALYSGERLTGAFERTASRLIEMRSAEFLAREHRG